MSNEPRTSAVRWRQWSSVCLLWLSVAASVGCRQHPQVSSRESLEFIKQVYTACNTRSPERLAACRSKYEQLVSLSQLSDREQKSFRAIIASAEAGDWEAAQKSSLQFARDQVR